MNRIPIDRPPPHLRRKALELVFDDLPAEDRLEQADRALAEAARNESALEGLLCCQESGRLAGAVLAQRQPGKTAAVWLPRLAPGAPTEWAHALMAAACGWIQGQSVVVAQTLLATVPELDRQVLKAAHFTHLAELLYLAVTSDRFPERRPAGMLRFVPGKAAGEEHLAAIVEATYEATRDCAALDGVRQIGDVLDGYRTLGHSGTEEWFLVRYGSQDAGCLILADHPQQGNLELVYMGILPTWRGRGWGIEVAQWAEWRARLRGRERLVLAVDAENGPALAAYVAAGFRAWDQQSVYIRTFGS